MVVFDAVHTSVALNVYIKLINQHYWVPIFNTTLLYVKIHFGVLFMHGPDDTRSDIS